MAELDGIKTCRKCGASSANVVFPRGRAQCSPCVAEKRKADRNQPHIKARDLAKHREWNAQNADVILASNRARRADPELREQRLTAQREHYRKNRDYLSAKAWLHRLDQTEEFKQAERARSARYRPAILAKRRAAMKNALPQWADMAEIKAVYAGAKRMSEKFRRVFHVDHIVPLSSSSVCGLHVTANLQVLEKTLNHEKNNKWWPDMWATS